MSFCLEMSACGFSSQASRSTWWAMGTHDKHGPCKLKRLPCKIPHSWICRYIIHNIQSCKMNYDWKMHMWCRYNWTTWRINAAKQLGCRLLPPSRYLTPADQLMLNMFNVLTVVILAETEAMWSRRLHGQIHHCAAGEASKDLVPSCQAVIILIYIYSQLSRFLKFSLWETHGEQRRNHLRTARSWEKLRSSALPLCSWLPNPKLPGWQDLTPTQQ